LTIKPVNVKSASEPARNYSFVICIISLDILGSALNTSLFKVPVTYSLQVSELLMVNTFREWSISCPLFRRTACINAFFAPRA